MGWVRFLLLLVLEWVVWFGVEREGFENGVMILLFWVCHSKVRSSAGTFLIPSVLRGQEGAGVF